MSYFSFGDLLNITKTPLQKQGQGDAGRRRMLSISAEDEEDELDKICRLREETRQLLANVLPKIEVQMKASERIRDAYTDWGGYLREQRAEILSLMKDIKNEKRAFEEELSGLYAQIYSLTIDIRETYETIREEAERVNRKKEQLEKWCWVPFYNISLWVEYDDSVSAYYKKCEDMEQQRAKLEKEVYEKQQYMEQKHLSCNGWTALLHKLDCDNIQICEYSNKASLMLAQWNQFYSFFVKLNTDIMTVDDVQGILNSANEELRKASIAEQQVDKQVFIMPGTFTGRYEILTYDQKFHLIHDDAYLYLMEKENHYQKSFYKIISFLDGACLIWNDEKKILRFYTGGELGFSDLKADEDFINSAYLFRIEKYPEKENCYKIFQDNGTTELCMDVRWGNFSDYTKIQMHEKNGTVSQKFVLSRKK